jgi:S1-C subfamily serine protease
LREVPAEPLELVARTADGARGEALIGPEPGAVEVVEIFIGPLSAPAGFLGLSVRPEGAQLLLGPLAPSGPAAQAGLREGDVLLAVDGHPVANIMEVEERLDGAPGTTVVLTVRREGSEQSFSVLRAP